MSNVLPEHDSPLKELLEGFRHLFVDIARLKPEPGYEVKRGGYCDLQVAILDNGIPGASKLVAAKKLFLGTRSTDPKRLAFRLARELKVWAGLCHPHVLPLLGFYVGDNYKTAVLISEYMIYGDLKEYIAKMEPNYDERLGLVRDLTEGLAYLHTQTGPVRHGDLKPGNVLVNSQRRALLADFGLSKALDTDPTGFTTGNDARGTVRFSSPEVLLHGVAGQSLANDIWSWGCLVLEAITDKAPFADILAEPQLILALAQGRSPCDRENLALHPPQLKDLLAKCWSTQTNQRPTAVDCLGVVQHAFLPLEPTAIGQVGGPGRRPETLGNQVEEGRKSSVGTSSSKAERPPMPSGTQASLASQLGGPQQPGGQGSPFTGPMPCSPSAYLGPISPQMMEQAMRNIGLAGRTQESLSQKERSSLHMFLMAIIQSPRQLEVTTPRMASGGNPLTPGAPQPGSLRLQEGMPGLEFPQQQHSPASPKMLRQHVQRVVKRTGSPSTIDISANKRPRRDNQNGSAPAQGFALGALGTNGMAAQQPRHNGDINIRPPSQGVHGQAMDPMRVYGGPHGAGANPIQIQGPLQPGLQSFTPPMQNKPGFVFNSYTVGSPTLIRNQPRNMGFQQRSSNLNSRDQQSKVQSSPPIPNAKVPGFMFPPSHIPNPFQASNKADVGDGPSSYGTAKSLPIRKAATRNLATPPNDTSGLGSSANPQSAAAAIANAGLGADIYLDAGTAASLSEEPEFAFDFFGGEHDILEIMREFYGLNDLT